MAEIATFLLEHLGLPALVVVFGFVADYISTPELKRLAIEKLSAKGGKRSAARFGKALLASFLTEFLYRIFDKTLSWKFFARSAIVSVTLLALFFVIQLVFYDEAADQLDGIAESAFSWVIIVIIVVTANIGIDFLSNAATIVLLRLASASGRLLDTVIVIFADLSLTIVLFTLLFPIAIVAATLIVDKSTVTAELEAKPVAPNFLVMINEMIPRISEDKDLKLSAISLSKPDDSDVYRVLFYLWVAPDKASQSVLQDFAELSGQFGRAKTAITKKPTDEKVEMSVTLATESLSLKLILSMYYKAFAVGNVIRDEFWGAITLYPGIAKYQALYSAAVDDEGARNESKSSGFRLAVKCRGGEVKIVEIKTVQSAQVPCEIETAVILSNETDRLFRKVALQSGGVPISPFFLTSFASSVIYYFALVLLLAGSFFMRMIRRVVEMPHYIETSTKPFTILGLLVFVPAFVIWTLVRLLL